MKCYFCVNFDNKTNYCNACGDEILDPWTDTECDFLNVPHTVFQKITASPEVLAKELITTSYDEFKNCTVYWAWLGDGRREAYYSREEAIAATVAKLKEVDVK